MDKVVKYRQWITKLLNDYLNAGSDGSGGVEEYLSFDTERDHYQLLALGWEQGRRVYFCILHLDIKNGKIWLQENNTDYDIIGGLIELGVPKSDIVIGFHPEDVRSMTDYAVM
jgi:XisI protein